MKKVDETVMSYLIDRREVACYERVAIASLPPIKWQNASRGLKEGWKLDVRGKAFKPFLDWQGRVVIYSPEQFKVGDRVHVSIRESKHEVRASYVKNPKNGREMRVVHPLYREVEGSSIETETRRYISLSRDLSSVLPDYYLTWTDFDPRPAEECWEIIAGLETFYLAVV